jgi:hypothetical protein
VGMSTDQVHAKGRAGAKLESSSHFIGNRRTEANYRSDRHCAFHLRHASILFFLVHQHCHSLQHIPALGPTDSTAIPTSSQTSHSNILATLVDHVFDSRVSAAINANRTPPLVHPLSAPIQQPSHIVESRIIGGNEAADRIGGLTMSTMQSIFVREEAVGVPG